MKFFDLPIGANFKFFGKVYKKIGPGLAEEIETRDARTFPDQGKQADVELVEDEPKPRKSKSE